MPKKWIVPKIWEGSACYIIGGGPSWLSEFDIPQHVIHKVKQYKRSVSLYSPYMQFLHDKHVIGVNGAFQLGDWISVCAFMDMEWYVPFRDSLLKTFGGIRVTNNETVMEQPFATKHIKFMKVSPNKSRGIETTPGWCAGNGNSGAFAINVAYHLGVKRIYLFGFDMNIVGGESHFHSHYKEKWTQYNISVHSQCFPVIAEDAEKLGLEIYNVNLNSGITCFPKLTLEEVIRRESK